MFLESLKILLNILTPYKPKLSVFKFLSQYQGISNSLSSKKLREIKSLHNLDYNNLKYFRVLGDLSV